MNKRPAADMQIKAKRAVSIPLFNASSLLSAPINCPTSVVAAMENRYRAS